MCSLSPCIKSSALRFKIPRESLHIPMDKRAQQLIDPTGISRRWFFKQMCLWGLLCHSDLNTYCTLVKCNLTHSTTAAQKLKKVTHTHWKNRPRKMLDTVLYVKGKNWNIFTCNNNDKKEYFKFIELFIQMINLSSYHDKLCLGTK